MGLVGLPSLSVELSPLNNRVVESPMSWVILLTYW